MQKRERPSRPRSKDAAHGASKDADDEKSRPKRPKSDARALPLPTSQAGLALFMAPGSLTGYRCVSRSATSTTRPFEVRVSHNGRKEHLGSFETATEAAYCFACYKNDLPYEMPPTGAAPSPRAGANGPAPLTPDEALKHAAAEGLNLIRDPHTLSGWRGVSYSPQDSGSRPYRGRTARRTSDSRCPATAFTFRPSSRS